MKKIALAAAVATAFAAPAFADGHTTGFAIMHFNMDQDSSGDRSMVPAGMVNTSDLNAGTTLAEVFGRLNMDADSMMSETGTNPNGVTIIMSDPSRAADIFRRLMAESAMDE